MKQIFNNGVALATTSYLKAGAANLTVAAGDVIKFEILDTSPVVDVVLNTWSYTVLAGDVASINAQPLHVLVNYIHTVVFGNEKVPFHYVDTTSHGVLASVVDILDLQFGVNDIAFRWSNGVTVVNTSNASFQNLDAGTDYVEPAASDDSSVATNVASGVLGYVLGRSL